MLMQYLKPRATPWAFRILVYAKVCKVSSNSNLAYRRLATLAVLIALGVVFFLVL